MPMSDLKPHLFIAPRRRSCSRARASLCPANRPNASSAGDGRKRRCFAMTAHAINPVFMTCAIRGPSIAWWPGMRKERMCSGSCRTSLPIWGIGIVPPPNAPSPCPQRCSKPQVCALHSMPTWRCLMAHPTLLGPWVRRFLLDYMGGERNLARNTQRSYRDTLTLLLPFVAIAQRAAVDRLTVAQVAPEVIRRFLHHLETTRHCSIATRNQRLAAIHAVARFSSVHSPAHIAWCGTIRDIPCKKAPQPVIAYLEKDEMEALLAAPDQTTAQGQRDSAMLLFLYNTGARASEATNVSVADLALTPTPSVKLWGKGNKSRYCPLWPLPVHTRVVL